MGNSACCQSEDLLPDCDRSKDSLSSNSGISRVIHTQSDEPKVSSWQVPAEKAKPNPAKGISELHRFDVSLSKDKSQKLGLVFHYLPERRVLPIVKLIDGYVVEWNECHPETAIVPGDCIVAVNGIGESATVMRELVKSCQASILSICRGLSLDSLVADIETLIRNDGSNGARMIRYSWHRAGIHSGKIRGRSSEAITNLVSSQGESQSWNDLQESFPQLMKPITDKYCGALISQADLWMLAANTAIRLLGGPMVPTRFGRGDVQPGMDNASKAKPSDGQSRLSKSNLEDQEIVALYLQFSQLLRSSKSGDSKASWWDPLIIQDSKFQSYVNAYGQDQERLSLEFIRAWVKIQEKDSSGNLRDVL